MAVAFLAASLAPGVAITAYELLTKLISGHLGTHTLNGALAVNLVIWAVSAAHVVILGMPFVYVLKKFHRLNGWTVCLAGFIGGMIPVGTITGLSIGIFTGVSSRSLATWLSFLQGMSMMGALGAISALTFWLVWRRINKPAQPHRPAIPPMHVAADTTSTTT